LDHTHLREGTLGGAELAMLEIPYSKKMVDAFLPAAGGSILAAGWVLPMTRQS